MAIGDAMTKNSVLARRSFLKTAAQGALAAPILASLGDLARAQQPHPPQKPSGLIAPASPQHADAAAAWPKSKVSLNVRDYGASGDGPYKDTAAIQQTI